MDWMKWSGRFQTEQANLENKYQSWLSIAGPGEHELVFAEMDHGAENEVLEAIRLFANTGSWPELSAPAAAMILVRLEFAAQLCLDLNFLQAALRGPKLPRWNRAKMIGWMLVTAWEHIGFGQIVGVLEDLHLACKRRLPSADADGHTSGAI